MKFPRFWAKANSGGFSCWRWSDESQAEAQRLAQENARKLADKMVGCETRLARYAYGERPLREPITREITATDGAIIGLISRNAYGCAVLNTARVMFLDLDRSNESSGGGDGTAGKRSGGGIFQRFLGKAKADEPPQNEWYAPAVAPVKKWLAQRPDWGWRAYKTRAGYRLLVTHQFFDPKSAMTADVFQALEVDTLYRQLCASQESFRARLTPKPWRCGASAPGIDWPFRDTKAEEKFKRWQDQYEKDCRDWATCRLLATGGSTIVPEEIQRIIGVHDELTRATSGLPLA